MIRSALLAITLVASLAGCAAAPVAVSPRLAQTRACQTDADCRMPLPRPRACPGGGQSVPTACCRMNYCGVCWSDCPGSAPHGNSFGATPIVM